MASSNKRERDLARAHFQSQQERKAAEAAAQRRRQQIIGGVVALVVVVAGIGWFALSSRSSDVPVALPTPEASPSPSDSVAGCTEPVPPTTKTQTWPKAPANTLAKGKTYTITLATNCGNVVLTSLPDKASGTVKAPATVNSQLFLTQQKFFDASSCFRLTTASLYVLQCGSPTNNGQGGPGYTVPDENLPASGTDNYPAGTVAMANAGPGTTGSQFFLVYKNTSLPPSYTIWGKVVSGLDVLTKVAEQGVEDGSGDGAPLQPLVITKATTSLK